MNTYAIEVDGLTHEPFKSIAETASKAKYECFQYFTGELSYDLTFKEFLQSLSYCRKIAGFKPSDLFGNRDTFERVKEHRGIEFAYMGMKVDVCGKKGVIVGGNSSLNLDVCFDGQYWVSNCHPWYNIKYFDRKGNIMKEYPE